MKGLGLLVALTLLGEIYNTHCGLTSQEKKIELFNVRQMIKLLSHESTVRDDGLKDYTKNALDDKIIEAIKKALENPALDPLKIDEIQFDINETIAQLNGTVGTISAVGIPDLIIEKLHVNVLLLKADFAFKLPSLFVNGTYDVDGVFEVYVPVYGNGPFEISVSNLTAAGTAKIGIKGTSFYIKSLDLDLGLGGFHVNIQHLLDDDELSELINNMINDMGMQVLESNKDLIEGLVSQKVIEIINSILKNMKTQDILDTLGNEN